MSFSPFFGHLGKFDPASGGKSVYFDSFPSIERLLEGKMGWVLKPWN